MKVIKYDHKRYIETGMHDAHNTEVKSGIEEGEKVFLKNNTTLPEEYTELLIERKDFEFVKETLAKAWFNPYSPTNAYKLELPSISRVVKFLKKDNPPSRLSRFVTAGTSFSLRDVNGESVLRPYSLKE